MMNRCMIFYVVVYMMASTFRLDYKLETKLMSIYSTDCVHGRLYTLVTNPMSFLHFPGQSRRSEHDQYATPSTHTYNRK